MGKLKGQAILLSKWVAGSPGSYKTIVCITDLSINRTAEEIDTSSKCDDGYSSFLAGRKNIDVNLSGVSEFAPATGTLGWADLVTSWDGSVEETWKIGGTGFTPYYFTGTLMTLNDTYNDGEAVKFDGSMKVNGATTETDPNA